MFSSSGRNRMGSNALTTQAQGGGFKKAGIPTRVGIDAWTFSAYGHNGLLNLQFMQKTPKGYPASQNLPVGSPVTMGRVMH